MMNRNRLLTQLNDWDRYYNTYRHGQALSGSLSSLSGGATAQVNTRLQETILKLGKAWVDRDCRELKNRYGQGTNSSPCIDKIHESYDGAVRREAYCAKFAYVVYWEACQYAKIHPVLAKTAGARLMLEESRGRLRVDSTPVPGAVFYRKSGLSNRSNEISGHIGTVYAIDEKSDSKYLVTFEGNYSDRVTFVTYSRSSVTSAKNGFQFIHTEESWVPMWYPPTVPQPVERGVENPWWDPFGTLNRP